MTVLTPTRERSRSRPWLRGRRLALALTLSVLLAVGAGAWLLLRDDSSAAAAPSTATVSRETVEETVSASGTVTAARSEDHSFAVGGTVTTVYVAEGDTVRKGQQLAAVDGEALVAARTAARSALDAAESQRSEDSSAGASEVQLAADDAAVSAAKADLAAARQAVDDVVLRAEVRGTVTSVGIRVGDTVGSGTVASGSGASGGGTSTESTTDAGTITVMSSRRFVVDATVGSADVEQLAEGLQVEITVSGVKDIVYGTVQSIGVVAQTDSSGAAVFPVTVEVTGTTDDLFAGTSAELTITVQQTDGVMTVASRALRTDDQGATYVDRVTDDGTERVDVEVGTTYGARTEVLSGLDEGDVVQLPTIQLPGGDGEGERERGENGGFPGGSPEGGFPGGGGFGRPQ